MKEFVMKALVIAAVMVAAAGGAQAQDLAAGETSFKKCLPCHRVGPEAKNLVGPVLNGLEGRKSARLKDTITPRRTRTPASPGARTRSRNTSPIRARKFPAPRWCL